MRWGRVDGGTKRALSVRSNMATRLQGEDLGGFAQKPEHPELECVTAKTELKLKCDRIQRARAIDCLLNLSVLGQLPHPLPANYPVFESNLNYVLRKRETSRHRRGNCCG